LSDAQLAIARESGFPSWARLKRHIEAPTLTDRLDLKHHERIEDPVFRRAVELLDAGDVEGLRGWLKTHPGLVRQHVLFEGGNYFRSPTLLEFVAENPIRNGRLPGNIAEVARVILEAGPEQAARNEALMLVATGSVVREAGVQVPLIRLLVEYGAEAGSPVRLAAVLSEHASVRELLRLGERLDLPVAAALGYEAECRALLGGASAEDRHLALAVAVNFGHVAIVRALLDAREDPNRYNPVGGHSHGTPLHHAAGAGDLEMVRLLVERGARLDRKDVLWRATPAEWAAHEGKVEVERYLRGRESDSRS